MLHFNFFNYNIIAINYRMVITTMKQRVIDLDNQNINETLATKNINQTLAIALILITSFMRPILRFIAGCFAAGFAGFAFTCSMIGAKEFFNRLPTSIEIIKSFFL